MVFLELFQIDLYDYFRMCLSADKPNLIDIYALN